MKVAIVEKPNRTFEIIGDCVYVDGEYLCSGTEFLEESDKISKQYDGSLNLVETILFNGCPFTVFEAQLIIQDLMSIKTINPATFKHYQLPHHFCKIL